LDETFTALKKNGCDLYVCSKGLVGPIRLTLDHAGLLGHFKEVYARISDYEPMDGYDRDTLEGGWTPPPDVAQHLGRTQAGNWSDKAKLCVKLAKAIGPDTPVMLVEDDKKEIDKGIKQNVDTCWVQERKGIQQGEVAQLMEWSMK